MGIKLLRPQPVAKIWTFNGCQPELSSRDTASASASVSATVCPFQCHAVTVTVERHWQPEAARRRAAVFKLQQVCGTRDEGKASGGKDVLKAPPAMVRR
eukprot:3934577-Rhodomonas_salina.3